MTIMAYWTSEGRTLTVGTNVALEGDSVAALVHQSGRPSRLDSYEGRSGPVIDLATGLGAVPGPTVGARSSPKGASGASSSRPRPDVNHSPTIRSRD
jgi:hypothetical protein